MKKIIILTVITLAFLSTWLNSAPMYASPNKTPNHYTKSLIANSNIIWVPDNFTSIQDAVNNATEGDTIFVEARTYYEHVVVEKTLSLVGENTSTIVDGNKTGTVFYVTANNVTLRNFTIQNAEIGIWLWNSHYTNLTDNIITNNSYGIFLSYSSNNIISANTLSSSNKYGIYSSYSNNNALTNNIISNNGNGIYLWISENNAFTGNAISNNNNGTYLERSDNNNFTSNVISNNQEGINLDSSGYNSLIHNTFSSNNDNGIYIYHSTSNVVSDNTILNNSRGIYIGDSSNNILSDNNASNNQHGIYLYYSYNNIITSNNFTNNSYGILSDSSSNNEILHNNFINNTKSANNNYSEDFWDNGVEGNYWSDYNGLDADWDGIGDTPYLIEKNSQDNYPLMATFLQFNILMENKAYLINAICNSTISDFQLHSNLNNETNALSFKVIGAGFCRISIPHSLIEPPFAVGIDGSPPLHLKEVYTNGTYTWLYFAYEPSEHEITITHTFSSEQLIWSQWTMFGLAIIVVILFSISVNYYRLFRKQKKVIEAYERDVGSFPVSHEERARMRFIKDVIEREEKVEKFKKKYGIKIQPASTLEDLMEKLGVQKES
jgi:parallel beta-helix repeat protein